MKQSILNSNSNLNNRSNLNSNPNLNNCSNLNSSSNFKFRLQTTAADLSDSRIGRIGFGEILNIVRKFRIVCVLLFLSILFNFLFCNNAVHADNFGDNLLLFAQNNPEAPPQESQQENESYLFWSIKSIGPLFTPVFIIDSVVFLTLAITNWLAIRRENIMPSELIAKFTALLEKKDYQEAYNLVKDDESAQGKIFAAGLAKMSSGYAAAEKSMNEIADEEIMIFEHRLNLLALIASVSPMIGLLGTVFGMIKTFSVISQAGIVPNASELAGGISMALLTTAIGLSIAIPALIIYEVLRNKLARLVFDMGIQTEKIMGKLGGKS
ncbi:MAG: MotA/TolQ/ExbB proton channel family protein [Planctomycetaceae bacterium]|nr:MotA/TolQ/ExbB proton channel family protein [Planctomycetaceae bacterium]